MVGSRKLWHQLSVPVISYTVKDAEHGNSPYLSHLLYGVGKTLSYAIFGTAFGFLGSPFSITPFISGMSILLAGAFLILFGLNMLNVFAILRRVRIKQPEAMMRYAMKKRSKARSPFFIGFFSGFLLGCGSLQAMYIMAAGNADPIEGAKFLALFGLGTLPALLSFGMAAHLLSEKMTHRFLQASDLILIVMGATILRRDNL